MVTRTLLAAVLIFLMAPRTWAVNEILTDAESNGQWVLPPDGGEARISGRDARYPELEFDLEKFKQGPVQILIETDATSFYVMPGRKRIRLKVEKLKHELRLDTEGVFKVDGKTEADWTKDWKEGLAREGTKTITLRFTKCEFVKVNWRQTIRERAEEPVQIDDDPTVLVVGDPIEIEPADPAMAGEAIMELAKGAVVELHVFREGMSVAAVGSAIVVAPSGLAVTNLHMVEGAKRVTAKIAGVDQAIEVTPAGWEAELDLALVQLSQANPLARAAIRPVEIASGAPSAGDKLWTVGLVNGQVKINSAKVLGTCGYDELDGDIRKAMRHSVLSQWVVTEGSMPIAMAGGAALNERGQLVGVPTWTWRTKAESSPLLSATHLKRLMDQRPIEPPKWDQLALATVGSQPPRTTFPRLVVELPEDEQGVKRAGLVVDKAHECGLCKGDGVLTKRNKVGYETAGNMRVPIYQNESYTCTRCQGSGLQPINLLYRQLSGLADAVARADRSDEDMTAALDNIRDSLREMGQNHFRSLQGLINAEAKKTLGGGSKDIGTPVALVGQLVRTVEVPGAGQPAMGLKLSIASEDDRGSRSRSSSSSSGETKVLLVNPRYVDTGQGKLAVVTGLLAGYVNIDAKSGPVGVLSHVMVVPIDEDKIIVRKTAEELNADREAEREKRREALERSRRDTTRE